MKTSAIFLILIAMLFIGCNNLDPYEVTSVEDTEESNEQSLDVTTRSQIYGYRITSYVSKTDFANMLFRTIIRIRRDTDPMILATCTNLYDFMDPAYSIILLARIAVAEKSATYNVMLRSETYGNIYVNIKDFRVFPEDGFYLENSIARADFVLDRFGNTLCPSITCSGYSTNDKLIQIWSDNAEKMEKLRYDIFSNTLYNYGEWY